MYWTTLPGSEELPQPNQTPLVNPTHRQQPPQLARANNARPRCSREGCETRLVGPFVERGQCKRHFDEQLFGRVVPVGERPRCSREGCETRLVGSFVERGECKRHFDEQFRRVRTCEQNGCGKRIKGENVLCAKHRFDAAAKTCICICGDGKFCSSRGVPLVGEDHYICGKHRRGYDPESYKGVSRDYEDWLMSQSDDATLEDYEQAELDKKVLELEDKLPIYVGFSPKDHVEVETDTQPLLVLGKTGDVEHTEGSLPFVRGVELKKRNVARNLRQEFDEAVTRTLEGTLSDEKIDDLIQNFDPDNTLFESDEEEIVTACFQVRTTDVSDVIDTMYEFEQQLVKKCGDDNVELTFDF